MSKKISQREARRMQRELRQRDADESRRRSRWKADYPGGTHIDTIVLSDVEFSIVDTAMKLNHAIVAKLDGGTLKLFAVRP